MHEQEIANLDPLVKLEKLFLGRNKITEIQVTHTHTRVHTHTHTHIRARVTYMRTLTHLYTHMIYTHLNYTHDLRDQKGL